MASTTKLVILVGIIVTMLALVAEQEVYASPVPEPCGDEEQPKPKPHKKKEHKKDPFEKKKEKLKEKFFKDMDWLQ